MTDSAHLHHLKMLSELRLPEYVFVPAFLTQLHALFPSLSKSYCWIDQKFSPVDIYDDHKQQDLAAGIRHCIKKHPDLHLESLFAQPFIMTNDSQWRDHPLSKLYIRSFLVNGYYRSCVVPIKINKTPHGFLIINWQREDIDPTPLLIPPVIEELKKEFKRGLQNCSYVDRTTAGWRSGLIIVDQRGEMTHCCPEGKNLLALALQKKTGNLHRVAFDDVRNIPGVLELIARVLEPDHTDNNHELNIKSLWGEFHINAFPVHDDLGQRAAQVYLNITWQMPFALLLFHNMHAMGFTPRQEVIGLLYAAGESTKSISNKLELSVYTIKEHIQHIFEKLQIHTRAELVEHILCQDCSPHQEQSDQRHLNRAERAAMNLRRP